MQENFRTIQITLPHRDHEVFETAVKALRKTMGRQGPDIAALLLHNLCGRDAAGLVEDYLEAIGRKVSRPGPVAIRRQHLTPIRSGRSRAVQIRRTGRTGGR